MTTATHWTEPNSPAAALPAGVWRGNRCRGAVHLRRRLLVPLGMDLNPNSDPPQRRVSHRRLIGKLLIGVAAAFAFGFALVPLYDVLCAATGFNGKTDGGPKAVSGFVLGGFGSGTAEPPSRIDRSRTVTVEFTGTVMPGLPWTCGR